MHIWLERILSAVLKYNEYQITINSAAFQFHILMIF